MTDLRVNLSPGAAECTVLTDNTIKLRCLAPDDADAHLAGEDKDLIRWLSGGTGSLGRLLPWIRENREQWSAGGPRRNFGVFDLASAVLVGNAEAHLAMPGLEPDAVNISYGVFPRWRGRGIAQRAVTLICRWLVTQPHRTTAVIRVAPDNMHSLRIPEALSFRRVGLSLSPDGDELVRFDKSLRPETTIPRPEAAPPTRPC
jgi:RimJ/RimL family protein N-acetyltransferase